MSKSRELISFFEDMLSRQDFLIPLVAASFQYPIHYYGMTSAALLEDLFVDASINFRNSHRRAIDFSRPQRFVDAEEGNSKGVKGWDYQFEGEHFSHKVGKGINAIALLWDATVKLPENNRWSYDSTMVFVLSHYKRPSADLVQKSGNKFQITSIVNFRNRQIVEGQLLLIAERIDRMNWKINEILEVPGGVSDINGVIPMDDALGRMMELWTQNSANHFEIFISVKPIKDKLECLVGEIVEIQYLAHPGIYVFEKEKLQNIEVTQNNRAVLLPSSTVAELATNAADNGLFVFMPSWYMYYAQNRPADLFLAQKQEFDQLNSAARRK
jgi:hypothetical protein